VNDVGEPCAGEPHARFDAAAGGNPDQSAHAARSEDASRRPYRAGERPAGAQFPGFVTTLALPAIAQAIEHGGRGGQRRTARIVIALRHPR